MQDFKKSNMKETNKSKNTKKANKSMQYDWLTKNRFWNLVFLFGIPAELSLLQFFPGWVSVIAVACTAFWIISFAPKDPNSMSREEAANDIHVQIASFALFLGAWVSSDIIKSFISIFGIKSSQLSFAPYVFLSLIIPILLLCYKNIPISSFLQPQQSGNEEAVKSSGFRGFGGDSRVPYGIRRNNFKK